MKRSKGAAAPALACRAQSIERLRDWQRARNFVDNIVNIENSLLNKKQTLHFKKHLKVETISKKRLKPFPKAFETISKNLIAILLQNRYR